jgi:hypothetical protein
LEIEPGTPWSDSECGVSSRLTAGIIAGVLFFLIGTIAGVCLFMRRRDIGRIIQNLGKMTGIVFVPFIVFIACDIQFTL